MSFIDAIEMCLLIHSASDVGEAMTKETKNKSQMATGLKIYLYLCSK